MGRGNGVKIRIEVLKMNAWSYFKMHFISNLKTVLIITAVSCLISMMAFAPFIKLFSAAIEQVLPNLGTSVTVLCVMSVLAPILQFSTFKRRRNLDMWYNLPISRRDIGLVHFAVGYLMMIIPFTACYFQNIMMLVINGGAQELNMLPVLLHYPECLMLGLAMYSVFAFVFNRASSIVDGIINMVLWAFVLPAVFAALSMIFKNSDLGAMVFRTTLFSSITEATLDAENTMMRQKIGYFLEMMMTHHGIGSAVTCALGAAAMAGNIFMFGKNRPEKVQENSDSWFCYKTLIPVYAISLIVTIAFFKSSSANFTQVILIGLVTVIAFVGYVIYRRGFHFKRSDGIMMGVIAGVAVLLPWVLSLINNMG